MGHAVSGIAALAIQTENEDQYDKNDKCNFVRNGYSRLALLWIGVQTTLSSRFWLVDHIQIINTI